ncbi:protein FAM98C [Dromaius novaehollandiae]|uniref:protein FAM98C n=1 Tax=Dromaius novaehollandiae TaxID=8790 RepID=UPI00311FE847
MGEPGAEEGAPPSEVAPAVGGGCACLGDPDVQGDPDTPLPGDAEAEALQREAACRELALIRGALALPPPGPGDPLGDIVAKVTSVLSQLPPDSPSLAPLLRTPLTPRQWEVLGRLAAALGAEYECRRRVMVTRCEVTLASFLGAAGAKASEAAAVWGALARLRQAAARPPPGLPHVLAARQDASRLAPTSAGTTRTPCALNQVMMGPVPDRGGRPGELEPPMRPWEPRRQGGSRPPRGRRKRR